MHYIYATIGKRVRSLVARSEAPPLAESVTGCLGLHCIGETKQAWCYSSVSLTAAVHEVNARCAQCRQYACHHRRHRPLHLAASAIPAALPATSITGPFAAPTGFASSASSVTSPSSTAALTVAILAATASGLPLTPPTPAPPLAMMEVASRWQGWRRRRQRARRPHRRLVGEGGGLHGVRAEQRAARGGGGGAAVAAALGGSDGLAGAGGRDR